MDLLVDEAGGAGEGAGGQDIHDKANGAGVADGEHLDEGHQDRDDGGGEGAEGEAAKNMTLGISLDRSITM